MNIYVMAASFLGTAVEFIEALTIVLAVGVVKGWKSSLAGMGLALIVLAVLVSAFGTPLMRLVNVGLFQLIIGILMMMFGMRWLRKAILRYSGLKALHLKLKLIRRSWITSVPRGQVQQNGLDGIRHFF
ncbi:hypothetical protein PP175_00475 [Aneurinibacillus sp. Ricciae_BoGa-3]|uniref:hypothetical protein n=1 Tax=Aneurinibacillus sp. Ricciae_BoGa-3 TaxID=3022697 RepID=UPI002342881E|nr:hypothetical protein [Aneurinibacillus sp. Ricciae_BoGa-3]WCK54588.1 hypothetical protein PP175_00475 [Aneurinibacillus sp. Ricciae_BoGa-3]